MLTALAVASTLIGGCAWCDTINHNNPHTSITGKVAGQEFNLESPKDTTVEDFSISVSTNGAVTLNIKHLKAVMNPTNTVDTANGMQAVVTAEGIAIVNSINAASDAMMKAAAAGVK